MDDAAIIEESVEESIEEITTEYVEESTEVVEESAEEIITEIVEVSAESSEESENVVIQEITYSCNYDIELQQSILYEQQITNLQLYRINQQNDLLLSFIVTICFVVVCYKILSPFTRM